MLGHGCIARDLYASRPDEPSPTKYVSPLAALLVAGLEIQSSSKQWPKMYSSAAVGRSNSVYAFRMSVPPNENKSQKEVRQKANKTYAEREDEADVQDGG